MEMFAAGQSALSRSMALICRLHAPPSAAADRGESLQRNHRTDQQPLKRTDLRPTISTDYMDQLTDGQNIHSSNKVIAGLEELVTFYFE